MECMLASHPAFNMKRSHRNFAKGHIALTLCGETPTRESENLNGLESNPNNTMKTNVGRKSHP